MNLGCYYGGAGSFLVAARELNITPVFNIEPRDFVDEEFMSTNFPRCFFSRDPEALSKSFANIDILAGSPDCKQFSNLGTKRNKDLSGDDPYDVGFIDFLCRIGQTKARAFVIENVPNINKYVQFDYPRGEIYFNGELVVSLRDYTVKGVIINAKDFEVPQSRKRFFLVGVKKPYNLDGLEDWLSLFKRDKITTVREAFKSIGRNPLNNEKTRHSQKRVEGFRKLKPGESYYGTQNNRRLEWDKHSGTIASHCSRFVHPEEPRTLTVRETAALQCWPKDIIFTGGSSQQLDQVGKAIPPPISKIFIHYLSNLLNKT